MVFLLFPLTIMCRGNSSGMILLALGMSDIIRGRTEGQGFLRKMESTRSNAAAENGKRVKGDGPLFLGKMNRL
jgi:hypothetical protein